MLIDIYARTFQTASRTDAPVDIPLKPGHLIRMAQRLKLSAKSLLLHRPGKLDATTPCLSE